MINEKGKLIYDYIVERISEGMSPTVREICKALDIKSTSTVQKYINQLCENGLIIKESNSNRSIRLPNSNVARVPILGAVAAGQPITAIEDIEGYIPFDSSAFDTENMFALRIQGESMIEVGIFDGDIVVVEKTSVARNGEIVVAMVDGEATVKTFFKENGHFRLQPENETYEPIIVEDVDILGKVVASIRYF